MKSQLIAIVAAVLVVGCGPSMSIHDAAAKGNIEVVKQHLAAGADVNAKGKYGRAPLHEAAGEGQKEIAELLIAEGADVNAKDRQPVVGGVGRTPLHEAAEYGHTEVGELLIANGADVNAMGGYPEWTALHAAAIRAHKEIAELLVANGADVNAKDDDGDTPLDYSIDWERTETADLLRKHGGKTSEELNTPSRRSQAAGTRAPVLSQKNAWPKSFPKTTKELMFGANPTLTDKDKAFLSAAKEGKLDEVKSLLEEGVNIDCYDAFACTALFWAAANNHINTVELLIDKGAYIDAGAGIGGTPLGRAAYDGHVEVVELLIEHGANVNAKDGTGDSVLDVADDSVAEILRKNGAR